MFLKSFTAVSADHYQTLGVFCNGSVWHLPLDGSALVAVIAFTKIEATHP